MVVWRLESGMGAPALGRGYVYVGRAGSLLRAGERVTFMLVGLAVPCEPGAAR